MKRLHPDLHSRLASEYVLGTMQGRARRRFQDYMKYDADLTAEVINWESQLTPLADRLPDIEPPSRVWSRIEAQLDRAIVPAKAKAGNGFWANLSFWRTLGLGASGLAAALLVAVVAVKPVEQEPMFMAVLAEDNNDARVYVEQPASNVLMVKMIKPWKLNSGFAHELWVIPKDGAPRSLGVINDATDTKINVAGLDGKLMNGALLAVSLEPPGGSPSGAPTGKVVCKGSIAWMPVTKAKPSTRI